MDSSAPVSDPRPAAAHEHAVDGLHAGEAERARLSSLLTPPAERCPAPRPMRGVAVVLRDLGHQRGQRGRRLGAVGHIGAGPAAR
jgi:hypothetical protein